MAKLTRAIEPSINVAPEALETEADTETTEQVASNGGGRERNPWTAEKVATVKAAVRESPGVHFEALLATLRAGELAEHLSGPQGRQRLLNLLGNIRKAEEKATEAGVEFSPLPEIIMPEKLGRPNLLEG